MNDVGVRAVSFTWLGTYSSDCSRPLQTVRKDYRFELHPEGDGCVLVFTHAFDPRLGPAAQHAAGWETYLNRLDAHLAGAFLSEEAAHEAFPALRERYAEAFGVEPAT